MEAAGFKKFIKKSISIKIKSNDAVNQQTLSPINGSNNIINSGYQNQLTVLQKQQNSLSNKLKQSAAKLKTSEAQNISQNIQDEENMVNKRQPDQNDIYSQNHSTIHYSTFVGTNSISNQLNQNDYNNKIAQRNFYYESQRLSAPSEFQSSYVVNNYHQNQQIMPNYNCTIPNAFSHLPTFYQNQFHVTSQNFQQSNQKFDSSKLTSNVTDQENAYINNHEINDDNAYDIDDEDQIDIYREKNRNHFDENYDFNYDLEIEDNINEFIIPENNKYKSKKNKRKHQNDRHRRKKSIVLKENSDVEDEALDEKLEFMKFDLKNVLNKHIETLEQDSDNQDRDLIITLNSLLEKVTDDDGSLTYDMCSDIRKMVETLFHNEQDTEMNVKKKKWKTHKNKSQEIDKKIKTKELSLNIKNEMEAGEINDLLYDDDQEFIVKKEYYDLLNK